jgi:hypothetical protein
MSVGVVGGALGGAVFVVRASVAGLPGEVVIQSIRIGVCPASPLLSRLASDSWICATGCVPVMTCCTQWSCSACSSRFKRPKSEHCTGT